ncbi:MAG: type II secretion system protein [Candidatus Saccharimonadales bacterium]|jgi:prepilin-type N-terminal cleavage/methylation domain-containing protein
MRNKNIKRNDGFTIIEVLIVLAIAGLIMLIVFLAVPALQRNARNTSRKSDASSLGSAIAEYVNNNDGQIPGSCAEASCPFTQNWKPGYYTGTTAFSFVDNKSAPSVPADPKNVDTLLVESYMSCTSAAPSVGTSRSIAIIYDVETGGGGTQEQCITAN